MRRKIKGRGFESIIGCIGWVGKPGQASGVLALSTRIRRNTTVPDQDASFRQAGLRRWDPSLATAVNPVENVWQFMRENWLSNRVFTSYSDILDHCCAAWNKLMDQPWRIMSLGLRDWAHGS
jgi:hypothetical protein